jgi:hypothetical protein
MIHLASRYLSSASSDLKASGAEGSESGDEARRILCATNTKIVFIFDEHEIYTSDTQTSKKSHRIPFSGLCEVRQGMNSVGGGFWE